MKEIKLVGKKVTRESITKKTIGYLRVSTMDQDIDKFKSNILSFANSKGLTKVTFKQEKVSGTVHWKKRELGTLLDSLDEGDRVLVPELSRLARSIKQIGEITEYCQEKKIDLYLIKENIFVTGGEQSPMEKLMVNMIAMFAEFERDMISLRTKEALQSKKEQGIKLGRPKGGRVLQGREEEIQKYLDMGINRTSMSKIMEVNPNTLNSYIKEIGMVKNN
jgi:DNA invertase Pin-like site-specific DNA recombinase